MNINTIIFVPPPNKNSINVGHYIVATPPQQLPQQQMIMPTMNNAANIYQLSHVPSFQQSQRFMGHHQQNHSQTPNQRQGYTHYQQPQQQQQQQQISNRYFYNSNRTQRSNTLSATNANTTQNGGGAARSNFRTNQKPTESNEIDSKMNPDKPTAITSIATFAKESQSSLTSLSKLTGELPKNSEEKSTAPPAKPQLQPERRNNNNNNNTNARRHSQRSEKIETIINKKSTKRSDSKTSQITTKLVVAAANTVQVIDTKDTKNLQQQRKQNDTMQRNSSKASHAASASSSMTTIPSTSAKSYSKNQNSSDSGLSSHNGQQHQQQPNSGASAKQRKGRGSGKRQESSTTTNAANSGNAANSAKSSSAQQKRASTSSGFTVNDWLQNDMYSYERRYISSCGEDKRNARHNPAHRNSTSSETTGTDEINSNSSYEDHSPTYVVQSKIAKKSTKSRQKRQTKRKQNLGTSSSVAPAGTRNQHVPTSQQPMDIDEDNKENTKPHKQQSTACSSSSSHTAAHNLRKECTKAAALKVVALNNSKFSNCQIKNVLTTSPSNSSVSSLLSSSSSSSASSSSSFTSISLSSSASSSPAHSANSSPTASPTVTKRNSDHFKNMAQALQSPLRQFAKLNSDEFHMAQKLQEFIVESDNLKVFGFPVESEHYEGCIEIYKCLPKHLAEESVTKDNKRHHCHYYGRKKAVTTNNSLAKVINTYDGLPSSAQWSSCVTMDSGNGSDSSSPPFTDSESSEDDIYTQEHPVAAFYTPDGVYQVFPEYKLSGDKQCVRCNKLFQVNDKGEYETFDECSYHWGKLMAVYNGVCYLNIHSCCQREESSEGCSHHRLHVWNGCVVGINGPYNDYVHTKPRPEHQKHVHPKVYAVDCEMSYTGFGLELTKITVVGYDGSLVYEHFVKPQATIADYNTRFSGITEKDLTPSPCSTIKTFAQVQQDILRLFDADTILIGHGLDNDLRALRLVHKNVVDTSLVFPHSTGFPYRRSLKNLTKSFLKRDIQCSDMGHSSLEDSRACLELMLWRLRKGAH